MIPIIEPPVTDWYCPSCGATDQTRIAGPHDRFHTCPRMRLMSIPLLRRGEDARHELHEREDYVGAENVYLDPEQGRPVMSLTTIRADGSNDTMVFAPSATARIGEM